MEELSDVRALFNNTKDLKKAAGDLLTENSRLQKQIEGYARQAAATVKNELKQKIKVVHGINVIAEKVNLDSAQSLKDLSFQLKGEIDNLYLVLAAEIEGKPFLSVMISDNLVQEKGLHAGQIISEAARAMKGGGGGQPFYATAGGKDVAGIDTSIGIAEKFVL
jgi:alanyl-tRNA synthetase